MLYPLSYEGGYRSLREGPDAIYDDPVGQASRTTARPTRPS